MTRLFAIGYILGQIATMVYLIATMVYLTFLGGYAYTWWNWIIALPVNLFLSTIWPLYWAVLHWIA